MKLLKSLVHVSAKHIPINASLDALPLTSNKQQFYYLTLLTLAP